MTPLLLSFILLGLIVFQLSKRYQFYRSDNYATKETYRPNSPLPYRRKLLLSQNEYRFYTAFKVLADRKSYLICPKVGLKDLFDVTTQGKDRMRYWARISQKHVDFVVCDSHLRPLFAIELDDKSHQRPDVKKNDDFKNTLFASCQFPLYRIPATAVYSEEYILRYISLDLNTERKRE